MGKDIIGIVGQGPKILKWTYRASVQKLAGHSAINSVATSIHAFQQIIQLLFRYFCLVVDLQLVAFEKRDVVLRHVVSDRVEKFR